MRLALLLSGSLLVACRPGATPRADAASDAGCAPVPAAFKAWVDDILQDRSDLFRGSYPAAPPLTCEVLNGLRAELDDRDTRVQFERLSRARWPDTAGYREAIVFFERNRRVFALMASATHFFHDIKILAVRAHQGVLRIRPQICAQRSEYDRLEAEDRAALRFLFYVLTHNPRLISGSENATLHGIYVASLMRSLDMLTHEHLADDDSAAPPAAWSEDRYRAALDRWRSHLTQR